MISISMPVRDVDGSIIFYKTQDSSLSKAPARVTRTPTLDGGAVIVHSGISAGDRTLNLDLEITKAQEALIKYIFNATQFVLVSITDGVFYGAFSELDIKNSKLKATILIKQKES